MSVRNIDGSETLNKSYDTVLLQLLERVHHDAEEMEAALSLLQALFWNRNRN